MDEELYDEFGNYIGPDLDDDDDDDDDDNGVARRGHGAYGEGEEGFLGDDPDDEERDDDADAPEPMDADDGRLVLHEDKKYYPTLTEVYGDDVEATVQEEDAQPITEPIIAPVKKWTFDLVEDKVPDTVYKSEFLESLLDHPGLVRNVAVVGHLHHGKTTLLDMLIHATHPTLKGGGLARGATPRAQREGATAVDLERKQSAASRRAHDPDRAFREVRYLDSRQDEQQRGITIKASPITLVLPTLRGKSFAVNLCDSPGHIAFADEAAAALRLADGVLLCVDALEGVLLHTEHLIRQAVQQGLRVVLVLTKLDRLVTELRLPPADAYHKLRHTIDRVNALLAEAAVGRSAPAGSGGALSGGAADDATQAAAPPRVDPRDGSVVFTAALFGVCFSLETVAAIYGREWEVPKLDSAAFARRLWGNAWRDPNTNAFRKAPPASGAPRSFVELVLAPFYKLVTLALSAPDASALRAGLDLAGLPKAAVPDEALSYDPKPLLKKILSTYYGEPHALADAAARHLPSPEAAAPLKAASCYTGDLGTPAGMGILACDGEAPLVAHAVKLYHDPVAGDRFDCLVRVLSGTLKAGGAVRVLGEGYCLEDEEEAAERRVTSLHLLQGRYRLPLTHARAGMWVLVGGIDGSILKTATVVDHDAGAPLVAVCKPLQAGGARAVVKVAIEPLKPSELPKMVEATRKLGKAYPQLETHVEESGEHVLLGAGELYLDCVLHDLRKVYADMEVKVADPAVALCETVADTSAMRCVAKTPNGRNSLAMVAEPLESALAAAVESGTAPIASWPLKRQAAYLKQAHGWDALAARSLWAVGPDAASGPNALLDDTLASEVDKALLGAARDHMVQGFRWATREGPLCDEPMRCVKVKLVGADLAPEPVLRGGGQVIPTARRVAYSAFLTASPRLLEPVLAVEVTAPADCVAAVYQVLSRRRGHVVSDSPRAGTPLYTMRAFLPAIDSFGFETDLRAHTQGQAFALSVFDHWDMVPGDPLDKSIVLRPLEPQPTPHLAREFMVKTRRRKGLAEDVSVAKFFDADMAERLESLALAGGSAT